MGSGGGRWSVWRGNFAPTLSRSNSGKYPQMFTFLPLATFMYVYFCEYKTEICTQNVYEGLEC